MKAKQRAAGGALRQQSAQAPVKTRDEVAKAAGLSYDTIAKVGHILDHADEQTLEKPCDGKTVEGYIHDSIVQVLEET